jgi:membrane protease YdiL (CAAX protease family)
MLAPLLLVFVALAVMTIVTVGPAVWLIVAWRLLNRQPVLEQEPRRLASWGFVDLVVVVLLVMLAIVGLMTLARDMAGIDIAPRAPGEVRQASLSQMLISAVAQLLATSLVGMFILVRTGCSLGDLGLTTKHVASDVLLGAAAFCALAIPTYGLQLLLTQFWPSVHPLIESLKADRDPQFIAVGLFAAVIAAPLAEEFVFRVLFQGWLEKMFDPAAIFRPNFFIHLLIGEHVESQPTEAVVCDANPAELTSGGLSDPTLANPQQIADLGTNPPASPAAATEPPPAEPLPVRFPHWITDAVPITASAALFAIMHLAHGPDFIALFFLAVGLGYVYRRTHRITPSLVVHFLLNLVSMIALIAAIYGEGFAKPMKP